MLMQAIPPTKQLTQEEELEREGFLAFYAGISRSAMRSREERAGWDDAHGSELYCRAMLAQCQEVDEAQSGYSDWRWA